MPENSEMTTGECDHIRTELNAIGLPDCLDCGEEEIDYQSVYERNQMNKHEHAEPRSSEVEAREAVIHELADAANFKALAALKERFPKGNWITAPRETDLFLGRFLFQAGYDAAIALAQAETKRADEAEAALAELEGKVMKLELRLEEADLILFNLDCGSPDEAADDVTIYRIRWIDTDGNPSVLRPCGIRGVDAFNDLSPEMEEYLAAQKQPTGSEGSE